MLMIYFAPNGRASEPRGKVGRPTVLRIYELRPLPLLFLYVWPDATEHNRSFCVAVRPVASSSSWLPSQSSPFAVRLLSKVAAHWALGINETIMSIEFLNNEIIKADSSKEEEQE